MDRGKDLFSGGNEKLVALSLRERNIEKLQKDFTKAATSLLTTSKDLTVTKLLERDVKIPNDGAKDTSAVSFLLKWR